MPAQAIRSVPELRAVALAAGLLQQHAVGEIGDVASRRLARRGGFLEQPQALLLEARIVVGVLGHQPGGVRAVGPDERASGPTPVRDDLLQQFCAASVPVDTVGLKTDQNANTFLSDIATGTAGVFQSVQDPQDLGYPSCAHSIYSQDGSPGSCDYRKGYGGLSSPNQE